MQSDIELGIGKFVTPFIAPEMSAAELEYFTRFLSESRYYLEFGAGGSTSLAAREPERMVWSVESDIGWINALAARPEIADGLSSGRVNFLCPRIGKVGRWGRPIEPDARINWHRYHSSGWELLNPARLDLVFVDGRFRVACAIQSLLHTATSCRILFHDFWNRPRYHVVLEHAQIVDRVDSLVVLAPKKRRNYSGLCSTLEKYRLDYH